MNNNTKEAATMVRLEDLGLTQDQMREVCALIDTELTTRSLPRAAEVIHRILIRLDRDSVAGRALARALGFTNGLPLVRASRDFCVSKQYLHTLESDLRVKLYGLAQETAARETARDSTADASGSFRPVAASTGFKSLTSF